MHHRWFSIIGVVLVIDAALAVRSGAQSDRRLQDRSIGTALGSYARIAIMRAIDGHSVEWEEGYIRHLEWHRQTIRSRSRRRFC